MVTQLIERVLAVKVPEGESARYARVMDGFADQHLSFENDYVMLPPGQWEIIGRASEIDESGWQKIVENISFVKIPKYRNHEVPEKPFGSATEAGHSLLRSKRIFLFNPYGEEKPSCILMPAFTSEYIEEQEKVKQWQSAQELVCDPIILKMK